MARTARRDARIPGRGMVIAAADTGTRVGDNPVFVIDLTIAPEGAAAYDATVSSEVDAVWAARCAPGAKVALQVARDDPQQVWIDWAASAVLDGV